ncbi:hypothetical protein E2562_004893 [Oryza meyeriana var. granulata]|uniref:Uncharacterized protein n=1 Tax=Oryza meyeriana var. granulata TaxID=110450 RepID=A0A6G1C3S9_9ORYZ|nr:hypothetical protein E2562_004893 [Oryza meyeriana var. granulata]
MERHFPQQDCNAPVEVAGGIVIVIVKRRKIYGANSWHRVGNQEEAGTRRIVKVAVDLKIGDPRE